MGGRTSSVASHPKLGTGGKAELVRVQPGVSSSAVCTRTSARQGEGWWAGEQSVRCGGTGDELRDARQDPVLDE